jgi:hypothetical protein
MIPSLILAATLGGIGLRGNSVCPSIDEIHDQVGRLDAIAGEQLRWVDVRAYDDVVSLTMWTAEGEIESVRDVPVSGSCEARARTSAVAIATWLMQATIPPPPLVRPDFELPAPGPVSQPRLFDPAVLRAAKLRIEQRPSEPPPEPRKLRGPLLFILAGGLAQSASLCLGFGVAHIGGWTPQSPSFCSLAAGWGVAGTMSALGGLIWLLADLGARHVYPVEL